MNQNYKNKNQKNKNQQQQKKYSKTEDTVQTAKERMATDGNTHFKKNKIKPEFQKAVRQSSSSEKARQQ